MNIQKLLNTKTGSIIISILLGLGLAAIFRRACKGNNCIVVKGPNVQETTKYVYKLNNNCYKYEPVHSECDE